MAWYPPALGPPRPPHRDRGLLSIAALLHPLPSFPPSAVPSPSLYGRALQWGEGLGRESWVGNCKHIVAAWTDSKVSSGNFREELEKDTGWVPGVRPTYIRPPQHFPDGKLVAPRGGLQGLSCLLFCSHLTLGADPHLGLGTDAVSSL